MKTHTARARASIKGYIKAFNNILMGDISNADLARGPRNLDSREFDG